MYSKKVTVLNQVGLFARPATFFTQCANSFQTVSIWIEMNEKRVNAKSLLGILSLGVTGGSEINIIADSKFDPDKEIVYLLELFGMKSTIGVPLSEVTKEVDPELFPSATQAYQYDYFRMLERN